MVEVTEEDAEARTEWRWKIRCGDLDEKSRNKKIHFQPVGDNVSRNPDPQQHIWVFRLQPD